jgi:AcrR family transcriptional regulator
MADEKQLTQYLRDWAAGKDGAADTFVPLVYSELHRMAAIALSNEGYELTQPTSLVHDLFLQLVAQRRVQWEDRGHFFGIAARLLRQILVARARKRNALKRGAGKPSEDLAEVHSPSLDELRYFGGLSLEETAKAMGISLATVKRHWEFSRRWLYIEMTSQPPHHSP